MTPTREDIRRAIATSVRNLVDIHVMPPTEDHGPTHTRVSDGWRFRLSPSEADRTARAALRALEDLGVIDPAPQTLEGQIQDVLAAAGHEPASEDADFGFLLRPPLDGAAHVLVLCEPNEWWRQMPVQTVSAGISQHLTRYAATLTEAGLGITPWGRRGQTEVLIVAATQESADEQAPAIQAYLTEHNAEPVGGA
ncbi:hypothetical protein [Planobispora rosea]|uniref:hypothetical protein n=1 Tax=Planobispora rosea TaxID=35762 RepID=UPI00083B811F|nr:hypothetical protein [Planobispora rosea]